MNACSSPMNETEIAREADVAPSDLDSEGVILSYCYDYGPRPGLLPKHFYSNANGCIYSAMLSVAERGEHPDILAVARELRTLGLLRVAGGSSYLATLQHAQPATAYPDQHVEAIREAYRRRTLSDVALEVRVKLRAGELTASDAWKFFKQRCEEIAGE